MPAYRRVQVAGIAATGSFLLMGEAGAGDILRGGAASVGTGDRSSAAAAATAQAANVARTNAKDRLARTTQAITSVRDMQVSASAAVVVPNIPNGLQPGGLVVATGANARWDGAKAPVQQGSTVLVKQEESQAILHWESFNVGKGTKLRFDQSAGGSDSADWIAFNKVFDPTGRPSQILGSIQAEGQVYIINQNGIIFGPGCQVNVNTLVASSLPINDNLIIRGLLDNPDQQYLFSALTIQAGKVMEEFVPPAPLTSDGLTGDVIVQPGALIATPVSAEGSGGRVMLVGANVENDGVISTPAGQTILAAGLQVGVAAHDTDDPSLRGLDVWIGSVGDYAGSAVNNGLIDAPRGSVTLTGKDIGQMGAIDSTTSVSLNGRVDLLASYDAVGNPGFATQGLPIAAKSTGTVTLGAGSVIRILPETWSTETTIGTELALRSQVNVQGEVIHMEPNSIVLAPNAIVNMQAGIWVVTQQSPSVVLSQFNYSSGQIYLDAGSMIDVAGTTDVFAPLSQNILTLQLRGAELADTPLQRESALRAVSLTIDARETGTYYGRDWIGTPLGDATGFLGLIERNVGQLTTAGGSVTLQAGGSVVLSPGSLIDVSGGFINYEGGMVQTTRVLYNGVLIDIADATPDRIYDGIYSPVTTVTHEKWGISSSYMTPLAPTGAHYEQAYTAGAAGGDISITAPSMALDGDLVGRTIPGPRQRRRSVTESDMPSTSSLSLTFRSQEATGPSYFAISPTPPTVVFQWDNNQTPADPFALDALGQPLPLREDRQETVILSPELLTTGGFGKLTVDNGDGDIIVPAGVTVTGRPKGTLTLLGANIDIEGSVVLPNGAMTFTAYNISPYLAAQLKATPGSVTPPPNDDRGVFTLGADASLSAAGFVIDDRVTSPTAYSKPVAIKGGSVAITSYETILSEGSSIDVSGGAIMTAGGLLIYGNAGAISIKSGQDASLSSVVGGQLVLGSTLSGYSGAHGGSLAVQTVLVQVGGTTTDERTLLLQPEFFNQGGFTSFSISGLGAAGEEPFESIPGVIISPGTVIAPVAQSLVAAPYAQPDGGLQLQPALLPAGVRDPVSVSFTAVGVRDALTGTVLVRGDLVMGEESVIRTEPQGSVSLNGDTVAVFGSVFAPSGKISITGSSNSLPLFADPLNALPTVYISPSTILSTAGTVVLEQDPYGRRVGTVLPGGTISIEGNIFAAPGSLLDVSGTSGILDLSPTAANVAASFAVPATSGLTTPLYSLQTIPVRVDSDGGTIILKGGQELFSYATLSGGAGGPTAAGGTLVVSSGRFYPEGVSPTPADINLIVAQDSTGLPLARPSTGSMIGHLVIGADGLAIPQLGYFPVQTFQEGGFDSLELNGVVQFSGPVTIDARRMLSVADGGVVYADSVVNLSAPYVKLGQPFVGPVPDDERVPPFEVGGVAFPVPPTYGPGVITVNAQFIDVGTLSTQNIGSVNLFAPGGDIRGDGTFEVAGDIVLVAAQIYPATATRFTIAAYDHTLLDTTTPGSVTIVGSGVRSLPLSAGGELNIYASVINQGGTLRAPLGTINIGWDGTGTGPSDDVSGTLFPIAQSVTLAPGSITSVSAIDPITGEGVLIPYGLMLNGVSWIDPAGEDITGTGGPQKNISIGGQNVDIAAGSVIDIRGGGDLYAYRWVPGLGGTKDILASETSFAVIPGYSSDFMPYAPFSTSPSAENLGGDPGYVNSSLQPGDKVHLAGSSALPAGVYTLLPARYALMPGAVLVTPTGGAPIGTLAQADGSSLVSGYRFNSLNPSQELPTVVTQFEVAPASVVGSRATYQIFYSSSFLDAAATALDLPTPRLPADAGHLVLQASQTINIEGTIFAQGAANARGGFVDIASPLDILIAGPGANGGPGVLTLDASQLSGFGAESLLIGGVRESGADGAAVTVRTNNITVDNAGSPLSAPDIILVARQDLTLAPGAELFATGPLPAGAEALFIGDPLVAGSGDGTLVRVSSGEAGAVQRSGVTSSTVPTLTVGAGATVSGYSLTLDSTYGTSLDPTANIDGQNISLNSGQITLVFDSPGVVAASDGLVLSGSALSDLEAARSLSLLSYSTIDLYGTGTFDASGSLALHAAEIRGFNTAGGTLAISARRELTLDNSAGLAGSAETGPLDGTLQFDASSITIGTGQLAIEQYANVVLNAPAGIRLTGTGGLSASGAMTITTARITAEESATQGITAGGALIIEPPAGASAGSVAGGLGASVTLTGASLLVNSDIILPSGLLTLHATTGDVEVGGILDLGGEAQTFYDVTKYTSGGQVRLVSDAGSVLLAEGSLIDVSAQPGGGNAGGLAIATPQGTFLLDGTLLASGGEGGLDGEFALDVGSLPLMGPINGVLDAASFTESRSFRVRTGDVQVDGVNVAHSFTLSADQGSILVTGTIDASGITGGEIDLMANGDVVLASGSVLDVSGDVFSNSGKGGSVDLEAGAATNGVAGPGWVDVQAGSRIDLSVASYVAGGEGVAGSSASHGLFTGTLHIRAPQTSGPDYLQVRPLAGDLINPSSILIEGFQIFDLTATGGVITGTGAILQPDGGAIVNPQVNVQASIKANGDAFGANAEAIEANLLVGPNAGLGAQTVIAPGAEIINTAVPTPVSLALSTSGASTISVPSTGGAITFPAGTTGDNLIRTSSSATIVSATGVRTPLAANTPTAIPPGSSLVFSGSSVVTFDSGTSGPIAVQLAPGSSFTTGSTNSIGTVNNPGAIVSFITPGVSGVNLTAGSTVVFTTGTTGTRRIVSTVAGTIVTPTGVVLALNAGTPTAIVAGSTVTLNSNGLLSYANVGSGTGTPTFALTSGSFTTQGNVGLTPATGNLVLGTPTSTESSDWDLSTYRFGAEAAPGVLTLRAAGNVVFYNALSDGFTADGSPYPAPKLFQYSLMAQNSLLPINTQSWSYRITAGADFTGADYHEALDPGDLAGGFGSVLVGKNNGVNTAPTPGTNARTDLALANRYQVIRTGSGDIDITAGRDVQLLNQFASIYTAGTQVADPTMGGQFDVPVLDASSSLGSLGGVQQNPGYPAQYSMAGGDVRIDAGHDIIHYTRNNAGQLISDSSREMPVNWLDRRGYVDPATGEFGVSGVPDAGDIASTTWWVDFSNFFEGVGALGGGDVTLIAGHDVSNVDAVAPTNARMTKGAPDPDNLLELGGGDVSVIAGHDIDAGVYYVERGQGLLKAGNTIHTNQTRSPSLTNLRVPNEYLPSDTWLPTTLFLGKGSFDVSARGDILLGPTANPFLLPGGINNTFWYKTYFSTYDATSAVTVNSLGGDVTLRDSVSISSSGEASILQTWFQTQYLFTSTTVPQSSAFYQPWLRLNETSVSPFSSLFVLRPGTLSVTSFSGDINLQGSITLSPSPTGTIELVALGSVNGLQPNGVAGAGGDVTWGTSTINVSDASPDAIPGIANPFAYQTLARTAGGTARVTRLGFLSFIDVLFAETGSTQSGLQTRQSLHARGVLHADDTEPVRIYASNGDISGIQLYSPKFTQIHAGNDITDVSFYIQNTRDTDVSVVSSGRDIILYNANSPLRSEANEPGNFVTGRGGPLAGDIQISGPGALEVLAGRNLDLGTGDNNPDGTGVGITSVGNARNPFLPFEGADIVVAAGIGPATSLAESSLNIDAFITEYVDTEQGQKYLAELGEDLGDFSELDPERQAILAMQVFYLILRDAGRASAVDGSAAYEAGFDAIDTLFGDTTAAGDIVTRSRDIRTKNGGDISILVPGGSLTLASSTFGSTLAPPGIITESGGNISILTDGNVDIGIGRIFTLRGGNAIIWSSTGDIAAGSAAKTVRSAPPTRVLIDPQSASVQTDLAGLATGGGIGVLATVAGVEPGDVDLIAPVGTVDAGDAGIRASGDLNIAAVRVLNADNISVGGTSTGVPTAPPTAVPNVAGLSSGANAVGAASAAATEVANQATASAEQELTPSFIVVEVLGYGGDEEEEEEL